MKISVTYDRTSQKDSAAALKIVDLIEMMLKGIIYEIDNRPDPNKPYNHIYFKTGQHSRKSKRRLKS